MPYVNIPPSFLPSAIAKITGKIEGEITGAVLSKAKSLIDKMQSEGCPKDLARLQNQVNGLNTMIGSIDGRLAKFQSLPKKLKGPLNGLKTALKIILAIPIPQAVPPGIGLPINITTKFADMLHLIKEFIRQISDDVDALTVITKGSSIQLKSITRNLQKLQIGTKVCILEKELENLQEEEELTFEDMVRLGLISDDGDLITSSLRRRAIDLDTYGSLSVNAIANKTGLTPQQVAEQLKNKQDITPDNDIEKDFVKVLDNLDNATHSGIKAKLKDVLDSFVDNDDTTKSTGDKFTHIGPNGILYKLDIIKDPDSPTIAPRRFAVAIDPSNVIVLRGPKSFSSSVEILLNEIKFRIDNQLP
jgi:hypothetical protein